MGLRVPSSGAVRLVVALCVVLLAGASPAAADEPVPYRPPVDAVVVDPFRPPATAFGPGNRGLTYDLVPGTPVRAAAAGEVVFAGAVGGTLHVTVLHADGLRTSYSFLRTAAVRRGQRVETGDVVGTGGPGFHFGVRDRAAYLDPAALFGGTEVRVRLVPHEEPLPPTDAGLLRERIALREVVDERNAVQRFLGGTARVVTHTVDVLRAGLATYDQLSRFGAVREAVGTFLDRWSRPCTPAADRPAVDASGRIALLVAGYGSDSIRAGIDALHTDDLGYRSADVLRFSYAGGRTPDPGGRLDPVLVGIPARPYGPADTFGDLEAQGHRLADLIEDVAHTRPGIPIDLYAHSQGGLVTRVALLDLAQRAGGLDPLGSVVTIGTPHDGTDLATIAVQLDATERQSVDLVGRLSGARFDAAAPAVAQMAETSALIRGLQEAGVPDGVAFRTIGARGDLVVAADHTTVAGHPSAMVSLAGPGAHEDLPGAAATTHELALGIAGLPPGCRGPFDQVLDAVVPEAVSFGQNAAGAAYVMG